MVIFVWLFEYIRKSDKGNLEFVKEFMLGAVMAVLINIPRVILYFVIDSEITNTVLLHLSVYASSLIICSKAIKDQEGYVREHEGYRLQLEKSPVMLSVSMRLFHGGTQDIGG